jgi:hypothetical protein
MKISSHEDKPEEESNTASEHVTRVEDVNITVEE